MPAIGVGVSPFLGQQFSWERYWAARMQTLLSDGNTDGWYDSQDLSTIAMDGSNVVSEWEDKLGSGHDLTQATEIKRPIQSGTGMYFDGDDDFIQGSWVSDQPTFIYLLFRQKNWSSATYLMGSGAGAGVTMLSARTAIPQLKVYAGSFSDGDDNLAVDTFGIARILFNGASSKFILDDNTPNTGNFGSNDMGGIAFGADHNGVNNAEVEIYEAIVRKTADSAAIEAEIYEYLEWKKGRISETVDAIEMSVTLTETVTFANFLQLIVDTGSNVYVDYGDGFIEKIVADGTEKNRGHTYPSGSTTYDVRVYGDLDGLKKVSSSEGGIWNIDVTEFEKAENIEWIGIGGGRPRTLIGRITNLISLKEWWYSAPTVVNSTGITGNIDSLSNLEVLECQGYPDNYPLANVTGTFSNIPNLKQHCAVHKITGDISSLTDLEYFSWGYVVGGVDGTIQGDQSTARIWGSMSGMTSLWFWAANGGADTITGDLTLLTNLEYATKVPASVTKPATLAALTKLSVFSSPNDWQLTETEVNQYLADFWANREVVRTYLKNTVGTSYGAGYRTIDLDSNALSAAPTGQGITDKTNLEATVNPADPGNGVTWTVNTN